jgi:hypothetical protein
MNLKRRRLKPLDPGKGPWLIWSHRWNSWHCKSSTGGAAGYSDDIAQAGVFDYEVAKAYHDADRTPRWVDNEAVPGSRLLKDMEQRLAEIEASRIALSNKIDRIQRTKSRRK